MLVFWDWLLLREDISVIVRLLGQKEDSSNVPENLEKVQHIGLFGSVHFAVVA